MSDGKGTTYTLTAYNHGMDKIERNFESEERARKYATKLWESGEIRGSTIRHIYLKRVTYLAFWN